MRVDGEPIRDLAKPSPSEDGIAKSKRDSEDDQPKGRGGSRKAMVVATVERDGRARARRGKTHSARTIASFLVDNVARASVLSTDELPAYRRIGSKFRAHVQVNHSQDEYVRRDPHAAAVAHTTTVESTGARRGIQASSREPKPKHASATAQPGSEAFA